MQLPTSVLTSIACLEQAGFSCYAVGGCVRDSLLGLVPHDWDLTTDAHPAQVMALFDRVIPTGVEHGTVTVIVDGMPLEVTTYRTEGAYRDHRHPEQVRFVPDITEDLRRRDLTVNAMAYHPRTGLYDPFGGADDLRNRVLRCVGEASVRFDEDALRVLRTLRFAATYGFAVEEKTAEALFAKAELLRVVAADRLRAELDRLLVGAYAADVLRRFAAVLDPILPELAAMRGVWQYNPNHDKDVWEHTLAALEQSPPVLTVRLALLLHDCGKPQHFEALGDGRGHFPDHPAIGARIAAEVLARLRYDRRTIDTVCTLITCHDDPLPNTDAAMRRRLHALGAESLRLLLDVKEGDFHGHAATMSTARLTEIEDARARLERVVAEGQCYMSGQLTVDGNDILALGVPEGTAVGTLLHWLLERVMDGELPNERGALLSAADLQKDLII